MPSPGDPTQISGMNVSSRLIRLDPGLFSLSLAPGALDQGSGLPAVRVCVPPGGAGRRESVSFSTIRADGWLATNDEPTLIRVAPGGGEVLVTLYWSGPDGAASPPGLRLVRLQPDQGTTTLGGALSAGAAGYPGGPSAARTAEIVAHVQDFGDLEGALGDWVGRRGSGRWIEGFSLMPRQGLTPQDFECRAVLGRDWFSPWLPGGQFCGSRGLALPLRGFGLRLRGGAAMRYDFVCSARFVDGSEVGPVGADQVCAAPSLAALEALHVVLRPRMGT